MDDRFFTAYFPGEATVCGRSLKEFTPFHYLLLRALQSPLTQADGVNRPADLLVAVAACRNQFGKPVNLRATIKDAIWRLRMMRNPALFRREMEKFCKWMAAHSSGPRFWEVIQGGSKSRDLTGPDVLTLITPLMMKTSMTESDVWNMSLGRAQWMAAEIQELEGADRKFYYEGQYELAEEEPDA